MTRTNDELAADILRGADDLAQFLFGDKKDRRKVYHLASTSNLPVFKLGSMICARRSILLKWIADQESRHAGEGYKPPERDNVEGLELPPSPD